MLLPKKLLTQLLFEQVKGYLKDNYHDTFSCDLEHDEIIFRAKIGGMSGGSCWEDSNLQRYDKRIADFGDYEVRECLECIFISDHFETYHLSSDDIAEYYAGNNNLSSFYSHSSDEDDNSDYYGNYDTYRTMIIPIGEISDFILQNKFIKPINEWQEALNHVDFAANPHFQIALNAYNLEAALDAPTSTSKKMKL